MDSLMFGDEEDRLFRKFRLKGWPNKGPRIWPRGKRCPRPLYWLRARVLYTVLPADGTTWSVLRQPTGFIAYAANVWLFVILFFLIDKRDEFQLVNFILKFKGFQAVSALISAASASSAMCNVRQDMADGVLDGVRDLKELREQDTVLDQHEVHEVEDSAVERAVQQARKSFSASRRTGGFLPYFLVYDLVAATYVVWIYGAILYTHAFSPNDPNAHWKFWTTLYFAKQQYALMAFPFLIFSVPVLGKALTKTKATGYDMRGMLCAKLSSNEIKQVYEARKKGLFVAVRSTTPADTAS
ncbi:MAG: hypothetical protein SGPRY_004721 [Prymnesium sp.]